MRFLFVILLFLTSFVGSAQDTTFLQWIDGNWVTEVHPNSHPVLADGHNGPRTVYNRLNGFYYLWAPADSIWNRSVLETENGWAYYKDTTTNENNKLVVSAGDTATVPNRADSVIDLYIPIGVDSLYSGTDTTISPESVGDSYTFRLDFKASNSANGGYGSLALDIGNGDYIFLRVYDFPRGPNTTHSFSTTNSIYVLDTFLQNGGKLKWISGTGNTSLWDIELLIVRTTKAPQVINTLKN